MPAKFSEFWHFDRGSGQLEPLSDGPREVSEPVVLATPDGRYAIWA